MATITRTAVLDEAHVGDIRGALGTISADDFAPRVGLSAKFKTLLAIVGPGLIVMCGDNDAGAFSTYGQAGQNYGTRLLWTLLLLIPVLYVNQEMVLRLGAVTGVGHARLIIERFGKFWGALKVFDLLILNALTLVTEFIGITLAAGYLGVPKLVAVVLAAGVILAAAFTGSFRRFERIAVAFCAGSLLLIPLVPGQRIRPARRWRTASRSPSLPGGSGQMATVMLLIIGIVGTTVAPWQLFFQQSYVVDKRITPRFIRYEKVDLWIGIVIVVVGAAALMGATAAAFAGSPAAGHFTDAAGLAHGIAAHAGRVAGAVFAVALLDAAIIGAFAVSLSTAYAVGDTLGLKHSLHRGFRQAKGFYADLRRADRGGRGHRPPPGRPARPDHRGRPGAGRRAASGRRGVPADAVQRPRGPRPLGQPPRHQHVHLGRDRAARRAVGRADRLGPGPWHHRTADPEHRPGLRGRVGRGRRLDPAPVAAGAQLGRGGPP